MFITQVLCLKKLKWIPKKLPHGSIWRGKVRLVPKVTEKHVSNQRVALDIEEKNMFYLRHPYVTAQEYSGVGRDFIRTREKFIEAIRERNRAKFCKTVEPREIESHFRTRFLKDNRWE